MIQSRYQVLLGKIRQGVEDLKKLVDQTATVMTKIEQTGDLDYLGTVALNLHGFYSGVEKIFQEIAVDLDGSLPEGRDWHQRLLRQMRVDVPQIRPAILREETLKLMNEFCRFRHVVRNVYTFELIPERTQSLAGLLPTGFGMVSEDLERFCQFLSRVNGCEGS